MKKIIPILFAALLLSGCGKTADQAADTYSGSADSQLANKTEKQDNRAIENATSELQTSQGKSEAKKNSATKEDSNKSNNNTIMPDQDKFEDLVKEYSQAKIVTNQGDITVKFYGSDSPRTVNNFLNLAKLGYYNGTRFHRVIKDFMIQGGDPNTKNDDWSNHGMGGPAYRFADEFNAHKLVKGSLAMANSGPNTNGSQFFIVTATETPWLDGKHTNFGEVVSGMDIVDKIEAAKANQNDHPLEDMTVEKIELLK